MITTLQGTARTFMTLGMFDVSYSPGVSTGSSGPRQRMRTLSDHTAELAEQLDTITSTDRPPALHRPGLYRQRRPATATPAATPSPPPKLSAPWPTISGASPHQDHPAVIRNRWVRWGRREPEAMGCGPFQRLVVHAAPRPSPRMRLHPVTEPAQRCKVVVESDPVDRADRRAGRGPGRWTGRSRESRTGTLDG